MYCSKCGLTIADLVTRCPRCLSPIPPEHQRTGLPGYGDASAGGNTAPNPGYQQQVQQPGYGQQGPVPGGQQYQQQGSGYQPQYAPNAGTQNTDGGSPLVVFIPGLAVTIRRLHDTGRGAVCYLLVLIPIAGVIILLVYTAQDSQPGDNQFGPNPKMS